MKTSIGDQPAGRTPLLDLLGQVNYAEELGIIDSCLAWYPKGFFDRFRCEEAPEGLRILLADQIVTKGQSQPGQS